MAGEDVDNPLEEPHPGAAAARRPAPARIGRRSGRFVSVVQQADKGEADAVGKEPGARCVRRYFRQIFTQKRPGSDMGALDRAPNSRALLPYRLMLNIISKMRVSKQNFQFSKPPNSLP